MMQNRRHGRLHLFWNSFRSHPPPINMYASTMGFDVSYPTMDRIVAFSAEERVQLDWIARCRSWVTAKWSIPIPRVVLKHLVDRVVRKIDQGGDRLASHAVFFEGASRNFAEQVAATRQPPSEEFIRYLRVASADNATFLRAVREAVQRQLAVNPQSRIAASLERVQVIMLRLDASISAMLATAEDGARLKAADDQAKADQLVISQSIERYRTSVDKKLDAFGDDEVFDAELVALADAALERIGSRNRSRHRS